MPGANLVLELEAPWLVRERRFEPQQLVHPDGVSESEAGPTLFTPTCSLLTGGLARDAATQLSGRTISGEERGFSFQPATDGLREKRDEEETRNGKQSHTKCKLEVVPPQDRSGLRLQRF